MDGEILFWRVIPFKEGIPSGGKGKGKGKNANANAIQSSGGKNLLWRVKSF
jgi:hypothetical protein